MRLLIVFAMTSCAAMAFNQRFQDSPVMMAHGQAAMDAVVYDEHTLKAEGKKQKRRKHGKNVESYQAASEEEMNAFPARQLKAISRKLVGKYEERGRRVGGRVGAVGGAVIGGVGATAAVGMAGGVIAVPFAAASGAAVGGVTGGLVGSRVGALAGRKADQFIERRNAANGRQNTRGVASQNNGGPFTPQYSGHHRPKLPGLSPQNSGSLSRQNGGRFSRRKLWSP
ncbi:hypothetical protein Ae201684P_006680 [Aphanomyces euteiches]|uniref:Glycine zipper domain-containing protein n=1 Tax=Aphanomyces euteiches TaxID=100861 RepID=A0A6G0WBM6_9STRA|nr:hypothetical protein Ae201684_017236 [Aphanomyces euteiches]KAH9100483.1 hypothetical protein Ae201684P_006680 [Aphanomyces euteiches]KAH9151389.1 hypothetical protein AeRB84_005994 [Aphanomyces euteiches]